MIIKYIFLCIKSLWKQMIVSEKPELIEFNILSKVIYQGVGVPVSWKTKHTTWLRVSLCEQYFLEGRKTNTFVIFNNFGNQFITIKGRGLWGKFEKTIEVNVRAMTVEKNERPNYHKPTISEINIPNLLEIKQIQPEIYSNFQLPTFKQVQLHKTSQKDDIEILLNEDLNKIKGAKNEKSLLNLFFEINDKYKN